MDEHWNDINLPVPSLLNYEIQRSKFKIDKFKKLLADAINYFSHLDDLDIEVEQITRFIFLGRNQFRMLKGFQEMKMTQQAAHRYQRMDILGVLEVFNSYIADDLKNASVPYRQNLDYVLIKLQGLSKLLIRVVTCARKSVKYFLGFIRAGSFYTKGSVFIASLAKIWDISRQMCKFSVNLFNNLMPFRDALKYNESVEWVANNCEFPNKLDKWLGCEYDEYITNETYDYKMLSNEEEIKNFIANRENLNIFGDVKQESTDNFEEMPSSAIEPKIELQDEIEDYTPIPRSTIKVKDDYIHTVEGVKSKELIKKFLKAEDKLRKVNVENSLTIKKVKNKVWKNFKNDLTTKLVIMQEKSLVDYFHDHLKEFLQ